jgi:hypothetical protein
MGCTFVVVLTTTYPVGRGEAAAKKLPATVDTPGVRLTLADNEVGITHVGNNVVNVPVEV